MIVKSRETNTEDTLGMLDFNSSQFHSSWLCRYMTSWWSQTNSERKYKRSQELVFLPSGSFSAEPLLNQILSFPPNARCFEATGPDLNFCHSMAPRNREPSLGIQGHKGVHAWIQTLVTGWSSACGVDQIKKRRSFKVQPYWVTCKFCWNTNKGKKGKRFRFKIELWVRLSSIVSFRPSCLLLTVSQESD